MGEPSRKCCLLFAALALMTAGAMLSVCAWFSPPLTAGILRVRRAGPVVLLIGMCLLIVSCFTCACAHRKWPSSLRRCTGGGSIGSRTSFVSTECSVRCPEPGESRRLDVVSSSDSEIESAGYGEDDFATHHRFNGRLPHGRSRARYSRIPAMTSDVRCTCSMSVDEVRSVTSTEADTLSSGCGPGHRIDRRLPENPLPTSNSACTSGHCTASNEDNAHEDDGCAETLVSIQSYPDFSSTFGLTKTLARNIHLCDVAVSKRARAPGILPASQRDLNEYTKEFQPQQQFPPRSIYRYRDPNKTSPQWRHLTRRSRSADSSDCWTVTGPREVPSVVIDRPETEVCSYVHRSLPRGYSET